MCWNPSEFLGKVVGKSVTWMAVWLGMVTTLPVSNFLPCVCPFQFVCRCNNIVKLATWLLQHVGFNSNSKVDVTFPESLQTLTFGDDFDRSLSGVQLPESLRSLTFGGDFNQRLLDTKSLYCKG